MSECGRCHRITEGKMHFIKGCGISVCKDCVHEAYEKCKSCGQYFAREDLVNPGNEDSMCIWCTSERYLICPHCREYIRKDEAVEFHGHLMCGDCRDDYFSRCDCCHEKFETTDLLEAMDEDGETVEVCPNCFREKFRRCFDCGNLVANYNIFDEKNYCNDCCEKCWKCGKMIPRDELECISAADGYHDVCSGCFDSFDRCVFCGYDRPKKKLHKINGGSYCEDCLPQYIARLKDDERKLALQQLDSTLIGVLSGLAIFHFLNR